jgi:hypothetical protein
VIAMSIKKLDANLLPSEFTNAIDLANEEAVTFPELARRIGRRRANRPTHVSTIHRWRLAGLNGVRLQAKKQGGIWCTTIQAYQRFVDALTRSASSGDNGQSITTRPSAEQANQALDRLGL